MNKKIKTKIYLLVILIIAGLTLQSCKDIDDYPTVIEGAVENFYTKKPIDNYAIYIIAEKSGFGGTISGIQDTILSDSSGRFKYSFTATNGYRYYIIAFDGKYQGLSERELQYERTNKLDLALKPLRYISLQLINKTGKYKRVTLPNRFTDQSFKFNDTTVIINHVVPDSYYKLKIGLYECENCGTYIVKSENIWIENIDTTYIKREF